jgi:hypothetical protein
MFGKFVDHCSSDQDYLLGEFRYSVRSCSRRGMAAARLTAEWPEPFALVAVHSSVDISEMDRKRCQVRAQCFPSYQFVSSPPHQQVECRLAATAD